MRGWDIGEGVSFQGAITLLLPMDVGGNQEQDSAQRQFYPSHIKISQNILASEPRIGQSYRTMKNFIALTAAVGLALPAQSYALVGGPFDQGSPTGLSGGTYEAIYKFQNGNGIVRFAQSNAFLNVYSFSLIFYKGIIYQGNAAGSINFKEGYATGMSSGTTVGMNPGAGLSTPEDPSQDFGESFTFFANGGSARNIGICNSSWFGKTKENGYNTTFSGEGVMNFFGQLDQVLYDDQRSVTGVGNRFDGYQYLNDLLNTNSNRLDEDTDIDRTTTTDTTNEPLVIEDDEGNTIATVTLTENYVDDFTGAYDADSDRQESNRTDRDSVDNRQTVSGNTGNAVTIGTGGESTEFHNVGHSISIKVYGSKVSNTVPAATGEIFTPLRTLTGDTNAAVEVGGVTAEVPSRIDLGETLEGVQLIEPN